jgi:DNA-binding IclR family transcriptional regulator
MLSTLGHAGEVLDLFTTERPQWGVTATARELGMPKSRAHDLLASLAAIGLLEHVPRGRYRLGWRPLALAATNFRTSPLRAGAEPVMREMAERHASASLLFVWDRGRLLCVGRHDPSGSPQLSLPAVGARFRANGSAAAKVLMAHRPLDEVAPSNGDGGRARESLEADLQRVRRRGYAGGREGGAAGPLAVAAPIRDGRDNVVAALSIAGPTLHSEADLPLYGELVLDAARQISQALAAEGRRALGSDPTS